MSGGASATAIAGLGLSAASTGMQAYGMFSGNAAKAAQASQQQAWGVYQQQQAAAAQAAQARWEQAMALQRKEIANWKTQDALDRGVSNEIVSRLKTGQIEGKQRAALAAQGTDLSGSPTNVLADTAAAGEYDAQTIRANATREAFGHKLEATDAENSYRLAVAKDQNARPGLVGDTYSSSNMAGYASILSGASDLAAKWYKFQQEGALGSPFKGTPEGSLTYGSPGYEATTSYGGPK